MIEDGSTQDSAMAHGTVLITGGTRGLGHETAARIARAGTGTTVVITGRDPRAVERAAVGLRESTGATVHPMALDLGSLADVRSFAADLRATDLPPLRGVVGNAGVQAVSGTTWTVDGFEATFGVNHLAHFCLLGELLDLLRRPARIVIVASDTHDPRKATGMPSPRYTTARELARPDATEDGSGRVGRRRYTTSKLCNVLMAYELARRLDGEHPDGPITVNAYDPGLMPGTGLARDYGPVLGFAWRHLLPALTVVPGLGVRTPRRSAAGLARLLTDRSLDGATGRYFSGTSECRSSAESYDRALQTDLWDTSAELLGESAAAKDRADGAHVRDDGGQDVRTSSP